MENNNNPFIKTDDDKILNIKCIRWVKKMDECLQICTRSNGCRSGIDTHKVCKINNEDSYKRLNRFFDS
jgi:hypothetical protein